jgi:hypothetical protein
MTTEIRRDEWLAEIERLMLVQQQDRGGSTIVELMRHLDVGKAPLLRFLHAIQEEGRLVVTRVRRPSLDGILRSVPTYKVLPVLKKVKGKAA